MSAPLLREPRDGFFVWTKKGKAPRFHHTTLSSAEAEACRLAMLNPGAKFIVMAGVCKISVPLRLQAEPERAGEGAEPSSPAQSLEGAA